MTLSTYIVTPDPVDAEELFGFARTLLGADDRVPIERSIEDGCASVMHPPGVGLAAWLLMDHGVDGPIPAEHHANDPYYEHPWPVAVRLNFDTAYGYTADNGAGCSDLHAWLVCGVAEWLEERSATYRWDNEFTGEWFDNRADLKALGDVERGALR